MIVLSETEISSLLSHHEIIDAVEAALVADEKKETTVPQRMHINIGNNTMLCMPSFGRQFSGTKLVSVVPGNRERGLPVINGTMLLSDSETGLPLAMMSASKLTALRTGALGAIGVKYLSPATDTTFGLIGCGVQGLHQAIFICAIRNISKVYYLHRSSDGASALVSFLELHHPNQQVEACYTAEDLLSKTNIIIAATTSSTPVLPDKPDLLKGKHFIGIGSYKPSMQELPDSVFRLAGKLAIDSEFARHETGDIINPIRAGLLKVENVFTIGKIITGEQKVDIAGTTVFKSAGMALFDLFVAQAMYQRAVKENMGTKVLL
jgi:ornithine cyclodeaminase/alanine dehydrogenase-like protein (mu-crystallin family)